MEPKGPEGCDDFAEAAKDRAQTETNMSEYALDNSWGMAKRRLSLLENYLDPMTRRLSMLGIGHGLRCLEVGAGSGSVASWLSKQVGPTGRVVATDIDIQLLKN